ncbi:hypothetical protein GCM10020255_111080 [Rhodococcus baikonurensis]
MERSATEGSRIVLVTLTAAGHELVEQLVDRVLGREAELTSILTEQQQAELTELLRVFLDGLRGELGDPVSRTSELDQDRRSKTAARPCPPPMHIVSRP